MTKTSYVLFMLMIVGLAVSLFLYNKSKHDSIEFNERANTVRDVLFLLERTEKLKNILRKTIYEESNQKDTAAAFVFSAQDKIQLDSILDRLYTIVLYEDQRLRIDTIRQMVDSNFMLLSSDSTNAKYYRGISEIIARAQSYAQIRLRENQGAFEKESKERDLWTNAIVLSSVALFGIGIWSTIYENTANRRLKSLNDTIKESEQRFRLVATSIPQIIWIADQQGNIEYLSDQWEKYTGQSPTEGKKSFSSLIHQDDIDLVRAKWREAMAKGEPWEAEYRLRDLRTNGYTWFFGNTLPLTDEHGKVIKWVGSSADITTQKELNEKLSLLVLERTAALNKTNLALQRSNEDLQQFAHVASHDLKEPVRKIKLYGNLLKSNYEDLLPDKGKNYLGKIERATERISEMIDGVLRYSSFTTFEHSFEQLDAQIIFLDIIEDLEVVIREKDATINIDTPMKITGSSTLIYQLFYNLINNALKFTRNGVAPVIHVQSGNVSGKDVTSINGVDPDQQFVSIEITDNGIGFDQTYAEKIFESFLRLNPKDKYEGTGLGLALCKKIVERHNGFIMATGRRDKGATFSVYLPS